MIFLCSLCCSYFLLFILRHDIRRSNHAKDIEAAAVGAYDFEFEAAHHERFAATGQPTEEVDRKAADRIELLITEFGAEERIELINASLRFNSELTFAFAANIQIFIG